MRWNCFQVPLTNYRRLQKKRSLFQLYVAFLGFCSSRKQHRARAHGGAYEHALISIWNELHLKASEIIRQRLLRCQDFVSVSVSFIHWTICTYRSLFKKVVITNHAPLGVPTVKRISCLKWSLEQILLRFVVCLSVMCNWYLFKASLVSYAPPVAVCNWLHRVFVYVKKVTNVCWCVGARRQSSVKRRELLIDATPSK